MSLHHTNLDQYLATSTTAQLHIRRLLYGRHRVILFDVGACEGEDSIRYAKMFPAGHVYSFEPLPANQELVQANFEKYGVGNASLQRIALSDKAGQAKFHVSAAPSDYTPFGADWNHGNKSSSLLPPACNEPMHGFLTFPHEIVVQCETLDEFCTTHRIQRIDFIHMDVQGAESLVLRGATSILQNTLSIWLEVANVELYRGQKLRRDIEALLGSSGFELVTEEAAGELEANQFYVNKRKLRGKIALALNALRPLHRNLRTWLRGR